MIISVVSGKGGAGKTTIATSLAHILGADYYDLDVDAPNGEYFLQPTDLVTQDVYQDLPVIDEGDCGGCGGCVRECRFNALYLIRGRVYLTEALCHSCGLCREVCPTGAISYRQGQLGVVRRGFSERTGARVVIGDLRIGAARSTFLIQTIVGTIDGDGIAIIDGPPGNACSAVAAIRPASLVVVVVEPTPFGIHDMLQTLDIVKKMGKRVLIVSNKSQGDAGLEAALEPLGQAVAVSVPLREDYHGVLLGGGILSREIPEVAAALDAMIRPEVR